MLNTGMESGLQYLARPAAYGPSWARLIEDRGILHGGDTEYIAFCWQTWMVLLSAMPVTQQQNTTENAKDTFSRINWIY